jgi:quercetin dioxygenase-like cupin family protein
MTQRKLGDVGTKFLWENEHVKVWDLVLEPGQSSDWHHHTRHYVFVVTCPGTLRTEYDDGTSSLTDLKLGQVVMGIKDSVHRVTNVGDALYSNAIVEMKS